jgi:hypothetical protein
VQALFFAALLDSQNTAALSFEHTYCCAAVVIVLTAEHAHICALRLGPDQGLACYCSCSMLLVCLILASSGIC